MDDELTKFDILRFIKKSRMELMLFALILLATSLTMPWEALVGLWSLLAGKVLTLTIGVVLAHLLRIVAFHYLDLSRMIQENAWSGVIFLAIWYAVIIYAVAVGG